MTLFDFTLDAHRAGRLDDAERGYRDVLAQEPRHADALHLLGLVRRERGAFDEAQALIESAIAVDAQARFFGSLGAVMLDRGRRDHAETLLRRAAELDPHDPTAFYNLGALLADSARADEAQALLRHALSLAEHFAPAHREMGRALHMLGRHDESLAHFRHAVELDPVDSLAHVGFAAALTSAGRLNEAETACLAAIRLDPSRCDAHLNLGAVLIRQGRPDYAERTLREALKLDPCSASTHYNLGTALCDLGRLQEAETELRRALQIDPTHIDSYLNLGRTLERLRKLDEAEAVYREGLKSKPSDAGLKANLSLVLLARGNYAEGWALYEARVVAGGEQPQFAFAHWTGEPLAGKSLLVLCEQGHGDALQFCRYLPLLKTKGLARLSVVCSPALARLFEGIAGVDVLIVGDAAHAIPVHDYWCLMMSLPLRFQTTLDSIPAATPYLHAPRALIGEWKARLPAQTPKVGLVWAGEPRVDLPAIHAIDQRRSLHARHFLPLLRVPGITFVSLQLGATSRPQLAELPPELRPFDPMGEVTDFADTAAIVENLDLVIAVDTSAAHLAGALNKPVWILSRYDQCWRWLTGRDDSPWYPSARLFRQEEPGEWDGVIERVADALTVLEVSPWPHGRAFRPPPCSPAGSAESAAPREASPRTSA
jgi:tetratricopeptide (TPR) repeat protein